MALQAAQLHRRFQWLMPAWLGLVLPAIGLTLGGIPARLHEVRTNTGAAPYATAIVGIEVGLALVFFLTALFVAWKRPRDPLALLLALTLVLLGAVETSLTNALILPEHSPVAVFWRGPVLVLRTLEMICALVLLYVFPDGRFVPRWTRPLALIWALLNVAWLCFPDLPFNTIYGPTWRATPVASLLVGVGWFITGIAALTIRYLRVSDPIEHRQTWWVAAGLIAAVLGGMAYYGLQVLEFGLKLHLLGEAYWVARPAFQALGMALLPICLAVAVLRYRLFDLEIILNRTLVHGTLTLFVIGAYIGVVTALSALFRAENNLLFALIATGLVAVLFQPLRLRLQRGVDRLIYGARYEPYSVLAGLGRSLETTLAPEAVLPTITATVGKTLKLPYVAIEQITPDGATRLPAEYCAPQGSGAPHSLPPPQRFPLVHRGVEIGALLATPRLGEPEFRADEQRLLHDLARQAGSALHALSLTLDLQRSRERIVSAREEERRRIRRDLHDGMGPTLASIAQRVGLAGALMPSDPTRSAALLADVEAQVRSTIADVRRLVYALRPPALDQYGLVEAIRQEGAAIVGEQIELQIDAPAMLLPDHPQIAQMTQIAHSSDPTAPHIPHEAVSALPAAVELALYRITLEALTNVVRHARARRCMVKVDYAIDPDDARRRLTLTITDDGCGIAQQAAGGVGLRSMRERADEIGGVFLVQAQPGGGTRVQVTVPIDE